MSQNTVIPNTSQAAAVPASNPRRVQVPVAQRKSEPQIEVLREGEAVRKIRVSCTCGCVIDIDCQYMSQEG